MSVSVARSHKRMMTLGFKSLTPIVLSIGAILISCPQFNTAIAQNKTSTLIAQTGSDIEKLEQEAINAYNSGKYSEAIAKFEQLLNIYRAKRDRAGEGTTLNNLGTVHKASGQYQKAIEYYTQFLSNRREVGDRAGEGTALNNLGTVHRDLGQYQKAIEYFTQSLSIKRAVGDRAGEGTALNNLGDIHGYLGQYQKAIEYLTQSLSIKRAVGDRAGEGTALNNLGLVYHSLGQYQKAIEYFTQSLSIMREVGNRAGESIILNNLGLVYDSLGQYQKAIEYFTQSLSIKRAVGNRAGEGTTLNNLGTVYDSLGQHQKAIEYYTQALSARREIGDRAGEGTTLNNLGDVYGYLGQYQKAIEYFTQALSIRREVGDRAGEGATLNNLGTVYNSLGQYQKAIKYCTQALSITREVGDRAGERKTLHNMGFLHYKLKKLPDAEKFLRQSIMIAESLTVGLKDKDKISFRETIANTYKLLQKVLVEQGKPQEALEISERARARALSELLASKVNTINSTAQAKIRQAPSLNKIQQIAKQKNTTLVQYSLIDDKIYIWVVSPTGKISFKQTQLPANTTIKDLVVATRDSLGVSRGRNRGQDDFKPAVTSDLKQLYQLLIAPIARELPKDPNALVTILPQDQLLLIPFAALQEANGQYLIDRHTISIAPSIQVLGLTQTANDSRLNRSPLVIGDPIYPPMPKDYPDQSPLDRLDGAASEARSIGAILNTQPLIGAAADKKEVIKRMQRATLIHLATHGFPDRVQGELPGAIALTNGFLTSDEIFDMQLQADLVVLSACNTGRGDITGDGVVGLSRSLAVAGVPSMVLSLWLVDDVATKALMEEFYEQLWVKKLPKAQAMRQAMLKTKQQFDKPDYWASFMLVGEGR